MIHQFATRHQKKGAFILFAVFYLELVLPNIANALTKERVTPVNAIRYSSNYSIAKPQVKNGFNFDNQKVKRTGGKFVANFSPDKTNKGNIGGPGQPEMSSFKSVNSNDMVDLFSGDFSYNIPLMDVGGYPVNLHYNSNISMDQEASWVGLGWNINPGAINRSMRGLPDDFDGTDSITKQQNVNPNRTVGVSVNPDLEVVGFPKGISATLGIFHNSYNGWGTETGINASINSGNASKGPLSGSLGISNNSQTGLTISPSLNIRLLNQNSEETGRSVSLGLNTNYNTRAGISALQLSAEYRTTKKQTEDERTNSLAGFGTSYPFAGISFAIPSYTPTITMPFTSTQYFFRAKVGSEHWAIHPSLGAIEGYISTQEIKPGDRTQKIPAAGYLYLTKSNDRSNVIQDFNREKELPFNEKTTPHLAIPQYTYDVYSISGEGTGGMFRPYRGDIGYIRDYTVRSKSDNKKFSIDLGGGTIFHGGVDFSVTNTTTENNGWNSQNDINQYIRYRSNDTTYQSVYFRNPGEMTTNSLAYYQAVGDDNLLRVKLGGDGNFVRASNAFLAFKNGVKISEIPVTSAIAKKERDKRSQVINYLTAEDARVYGLDKNILSYKENTVPVNGCSDTVTVIPRVDNVIRKKNHLSEVTVLNGDGRRYVYGLPAYNIEQEDVTFSIPKNNVSQDIAKGIVHYTPGSDNTTGNQQGKEGLFTKEIIPAYAHSFLLTGIVSPDYVDIKGDGISQDDIGDAIKFNYTRVYGDNGQYFNWRTPSDSSKANYNEGLKSYSRDDKATYIFGKKEVWYLNSIESKTMIAVFNIANDRQDVYSVRDENGGIDRAKPLRRLRQIDLYSKSDLVKNGTNAKPVKTVHLAYSYSLCKGVAGNSSLGKLTLDSVWFSYNGNEKGKLNPYVFKYHQGSSNYNPDYQPKNYDRWGNFKSATTNPGGLNNSDYPYAEQNKTNADKYAQAWTMDEIMLPSGGRIKATYESDDYAYIQNKRAQQFFTIAGISSNQGTTSGSALYGATDCNYVFINSSAALSGVQDLYEKYLKGINYLYFKLSVTVPTDKWGGGKELIPVYAQIEDYGLVNSTKFWIKLKPVEGEGALARSALQFLRLNLPSKAYPNSEPGDNIGVLDAVKMVATSYREIKNAIKGFGSNARKKGWCKQIDLTQSFVRLNSPTYKKLGGGLRVKRIEVWDNWNHMTGQRESVYGQDYNYTTTEKINGQDVEISSGVASYEPMIGAEENPFREPIPYAEKSAPMAPTNNLFSEEPLGESYYPSASVGYSKVRVRTINTKAKSANGWAETEFFTTKEFPTIIENTIIDPSSKKRYNPAIQNFLKINSVHYLTLSQGFKIELNDMNGKMKAQASYAETDSIHPISYTRNYYKVDNDTAFQKHLNNTVWLVDSLNGHINQSGTIGKDIEVIQDMREQTSKTIANNRSANVDVIPGFFIVPVIPIPSLFPFPQKEENRFRSSVTVKVIQRYGILDSVVVMDKGSTVSTKNLVYDGETGQVIVSRTNNEFNDPVYNFSYPAHWAYSGMGMAYKNIDAVFSNLKLVKGKLYYGGGSTVPFPVERFFESGDEVQLKGVYRTMQASPFCTLFNVSLISIPFPSKAWVMDASKAKEGDRGLYFIDKEGRVLTGRVDFIRILRSGKRNMLDASVGSIVSLGNPIKEVTTGNFKLLLDSTIHILNTSAVTYKDHWKVENSFYAKDTVFTVTKFDSLYTHAIPNSIVTQRLRYSISGGELEKLNTRPSGYMATSYNKVKYTNCTSTNYFLIKSMARYDLNAIPSNATILSATLNFDPKVPNDLWTSRVRIRKSPCGPNYSHDWANTTSFYGGSSLAYLKRILVDWNEATPYKAMVTTETNRASVNYNNYQNVNCTGLIQDIVSSGRNYGFVLQLDRNESSPASNTTESNWLSFYGQYDNIKFIVNGPELKVRWSVSQDSTGYICKQNISDTLTNPYRWGILGNWRVDRAYTFYHDRKESDASNPTTNIRKEGEIKSFTSFWAFTANGLTQSPDTTKWVWNSASALYNKKGFEIENYDPLGRYNAGIYGYDQTLPVAVAQNSKYRQILYDGFEDYNYKTKQCLTCPNDREIDFVKTYSGVSIDNTQAHTGNYSMKVSENSQSYFSAALFSEDAMDSTSLKVDSSAIYTTTVPGVGSGLTATYKGYTSCVTVPSSPPNYQTVTQQCPVNFFWSSGSPYTAMCNRWYTANWKGKVQAPYSDTYHFYAVSDKVIEVWVNGVKVVNASRPNVEATGPAISLTAGSLYDIEVKYTHISGTNAYVNLRWSSDNTITGKEVIPCQYLYKDGLTTADTVGSVIRNISGWCITPYNAAAKNSIRPKFAPSINDQLVISGWVKMDGNDCNTAPALENVLMVTFTTAWNSTSQVALQRTGVRIEGWQRYEAIVTVPVYNASIKLSALAPSDRAIYVDDIRVQPFNSQMKSYAYDQATLRLMAELDENNYGSFYEYDDDGTLIRVKKETERGVMTVKETRSALLKN